MITKEYIAADIKLRNDWFTSYGRADIDFIYDGATDPEQWISSRWRIMCLLKEAHGGGIWNHAEAIKECGGLLRVGGTAKQSVHNRMVEWLYAIECALNCVVANVDEDRRKGYLNARITMLRSAWINIKKANGLPYSTVKNLSQVAKRDGVFLRRQIELLDPKIILCGYTFGVIRDELFPGYSKVPGTEFSYRDTNDRIIIDYYHPARKARESYKPLVAEIERIKKSIILA